jgi:hypothetical protein
MELISVDPTTTPTAAPTEIVSLPPGVSPALTPTTSLPPDHHDPVLHDGSTPVPRKRSRSELEELPGAAEKELRVYKKSVTMRRLDFWFH